jgi:hypothetical protein
MGRGRKQRSTSAGTSAQTETRAELRFAPAADGTTKLYVEEVPVTSEPSAFPELEAEIRERLAKYGEIERIRIRDQVADPEWTIRVVTGDAVDDFDEADDEPDKRFEATATLSRTRPEDGQRIVLSPVCFGDSAAEAAESLVGEVAYLSRDLTSRR